MFRRLLLASLICLAGCARQLPPMAALSASGGIGARAEEPGGYTPIGEFPKSEGSGVVASKRYPGVYWAQRDSGFFGGRCELIAFKVQQGRLVDLSPGVRFRSFAVEGVTNKDWEDIALDDQGRVWIADMGNNECSRRDLTLYVMPEPNPYQDGRVSVQTRYPFSYPDAPAGHPSYDAESLMLVDGLPYIINKTPTPAVYRMASLTPDQPNVLERVADLAQPAGGLGGRPTGADLSADGSRMAVTTDGGRVFVYERQSPGARGLDLVRDLAGHAPRWSAHYNTTGKWEQVEGVAFVGAGDDLVLLSESKRIFYFSASFYGDRP